MSTATDVDDFFFLLRSKRPSLNMIEYWLPHFSKHKYSGHTSFGGKWLIFCTKENVDDTWLKICKAQDEKLLGNMSKVATALSSLSYKGIHVICVYSYDSRDMDDVVRIRDSLKNIGFDYPLHYKRDIETIKDVYGSADEFILTI
jgi:hypothetical protein